MVTAINQKEIKSQFVMMPRVFSRSSTVQFNILRSNTHEIVLDLFQRYETVGLQIPVPVRSLVRLVFDADDKVVYHGDYWYHTAAFDKMPGLIGLAWKVVLSKGGF